MRFLQLFLTGPATTFFVDTSLKIVLPDFANLFQSI